MIQTRGLSKRYGQILAVDGVDLAIPPGEILGFLGPNGAGKTTTIKMLVGLLQPSQGQALIGGYDVQEQPLRAKALVGYVPDTPFLYEKLSGREFLRFIARLYDLEPALAARRADDLLQLFDLAERADDLIQGYSHGMRQKIALAAALLHEPRAFFLDEPTVGLDPKSARQVKDLLRHLAERGTAIFMSTHILEVAERMCDRVGIIDRGRLIACGTMAELRQAEGEGTLEDIFLQLTGGAEVAELAQYLEG
ncbi:MAG: ABC transporter ATP-binding protein [Chloroflexia bacterium]|nr:ABC transporter ATP-binding protein [Chloroflexia bacterium]